MKYLDNNLNRHQTALDDEDDVQTTRTILMKASKDRTLLELQFLERVFERYDIFSDMLASNDTETKLEVLRELRFEEARKGNFVFHWGETGKLFYMVFKGSVFVMKRKELMRGGAKKSIKYSIAHKTPNLSPILRKSEKIKAFSFDLEPLLNPNSAITETQVSELYPEHAVLNTLKTPSYFGEIALSQLTARTASVLARETCYFAVMNRSTYYRVLADCQERKIKEKISFLQMFPATNRLSETSLTAIITHFQTHNLQRNQIIYKEGDPVNNLYFVQQGEIILNKEIILNSELEEAENEFTPPVHKHKLLNGTVSRRLTSVSKQQFSSKKNIRVAIVGKGEAIGDIDLAADPCVYSNTAICYSQDATIYSIQKEKLLNNCPDPQKVLKILSNQKKKDWRLGIQEKLSQATQLFQNSLLELEANKHSSNISKERISQTNDLQLKQQTVSNPNAKRLAIHRTAGERDYENLLQNIHKTEPGDFELPKRFKYHFDAAQTEDLAIDRIPSELKIRALSSHRNEFPENIFDSLTNPNTKINLESELLLPKPLSFLKANPIRKKIHIRHKIHTKQSPELMPSSLRIPSTRTTASIFVEKFFLQQKGELFDTPREHGDLKLTYKPNNYSKTPTASSHKGILIGSSPYLRATYSPSPATSLDLQSPKVTSMNKIGLQLTKHWESRYTPSLIKHETLGVLPSNTELGIQETMHTKSCYTFHQDISMPQSPLSPVSLSKSKPIHSSESKLSWSKNKKPLKIAETHTLKSKINTIATSLGKLSSLTSFVKT